MNSVIGAQFGIEVRERLHQLNITQTELAERLGIAVSYLNDILSNKRISRRKREEILEALDALEGKAVSK